MKDLYICLDKEDGDGFVGYDDVSYTTKLSSVAERLDCGDRVFKLSDLKEITSAEIKLIQGK